MSWSKVVIGTDRCEIVVGATLMNKFTPVFRTADMPKDVKVYLNNDESGNHIFYFNPSASVIANGILHEFNAATCNEPDLAGFKLLTI